MKPFFTLERRICMVTENEKVTTIRRGDAVVSEIKQAKEQRAFFHAFTTMAHPVEPSPLRGGRPGGQISEPLAIVEYEDGVVDFVSPLRVRFLDTEGLMEQYAWGEEPERNCTNCKHQRKSFKQEPCDRCKDSIMWEAE